MAESLASAISEVIFFNIHTGFKQPNMRVGLEQSSSGSAHSSHRRHAPQNVHEEAIEKHMEAVEHANKLNLQEKHALKRRQKRTVKRQKELYKTVTAHNVAPPTGRSLAMSLVATTAKASLAGEHHNDDNPVTLGGKGVVAAGDSQAHANLAIKYPLSLHLGQLVATKKFLLAQQMKLVIAKVKGGNIVFSLTDCQYREYGLVKTETEILGIFSQREQHKVKQLTSDKKLKLIVEMVNFEIINGRKTMVLTLPALTTRNLMFIGTEDNYGTNNVPEVVTVRFKFKAVLKSIRRQKTLENLYGNAVDHEKRKFFIDHCMRFHGEIVDIHPVILSTTLGDTEYKLQMKLVRGELDVVAIDPKQNVWHLGAPLSDILHLAIEQKLLVGESHGTVPTKVEIFELVASKMLGFTQYSDNKGCGIRILHGKEAESHITDAPILSDSLDIDPGLAAKKQIGRGWARAKAVANKINDNKYGNTIREKPFEPHAYVALGNLRIRRGLKKKGMDLLRAAIRLPNTDLQSHPFDGKFWKNYVQLLYNPREQAEMTDMDMDEVKNCFLHSLRFFQNLTDPHFLVLGGKILEEAGDITQACQVYARIVQNFPSYKYLPRAVFHGAMCALHSGNFQQAVTYFEFLLVDELEPYTNEDIIMLISSTLASNGKLESAGSGFAHVFKQTYKSHGQNAVYNYSDWSTWVTCRDVWLKLIHKCERSGHWLLANDLYKRAMNLKPLKDLKSNSGEGLLWWEAAQSAYKARDMTFAIYACHRSMECDDTNQVVAAAAQSWDELRSGTPHHNYMYQDALVNVKNEFFSLGAYLDMNQEIRNPLSGGKKMKNNQSPGQRAPNPQSRQNVDFTNRLHGGYTKRSRPLSAKERIIVQRLHEGTEITMFDRVLNGKLRTDEARFKNYVSIGLEKQNTTQSITPVSRAASTTRPLTSDTMPGRKMHAPKIRPFSTHASTRNRHVLRGILSPESSSSPSGGLVLQKIQKVDSWGLSGRGTQKIKKKKSPPPSNDELKTRKSLPRVSRSRRKKLKRMVLASSLGVAVSYSGGASSGSIPESAHARPTLSARESRQQEVVFFKRLKKQSQEKKKIALNYLKNMPKEEDDPAR